MAFIGKDIANNSKWLNVTIEGEETKITADDYEELQNNYNTLLTRYLNLQNISNDIAQIESEKQEMEIQLNEANAKINELERANSVTLSDTIDNLIFSYPIYIDGGEIADFTDSMLLVDEVPYYNENVLKLILGHYGIKYQYEKDKVYIGEIIETDKLPLSEAEV